VGLYFEAEARNSAFRTFWCVHFTANQGRQELLYIPRDWKISPKFREIEPKGLKITMRVGPSRVLFQFQSEVGLYIFAQKLESKPSKSFFVSISLQTKAFKSEFRFRGTEKYLPSCGKSSQSWLKS